MKKQKVNYLDITFKRNPEIQYSENEDGIVTLFVQNKGFFNALMQRLLKKPRFSQIHLEEFGSFIWKELNGDQSVLKISEKVLANFGDKAEPLLPRLVQYFKILENNGFVCIKTSQKRQ